MKSPETVNVYRLTRILGVLMTITLMAPVAVMPKSPALVNLGTSVDFVLLSKSGISATGTTYIVGDLGVSPVAATAITGFALIADAANTFATSSLVTGKIYAADYTSPTSTKLTTAISDMETAYTDAAGRESPDFTELYTGDITGQTLAPGIYKWSTGVLVSAGGVTIAGSADDAWIFQIAQNLDLASGAIVTLTGGAQAANIFWQVAGQTTLGTAAEMKGVILCQSAIVMSTGATLSGRGLAQTGITLDANAITLPNEVVVSKYSAVSPKIGLNQTYRNQSIEFVVPSNGWATIRIFTPSGQDVATLFDGEVHGGKNNRVPLSASWLTPGWYVSKLVFNHNASLTKMLLVKK